MHEQGVPVDKIPKPPTLKSPTSIHGSEHEWIWGMISSCQQENQTLAVEYLAKLDVVATAPIPQDLTRFNSAQVQNGLKVKIKPPS